MTTYSKAWLGVGLMAVLTLGGCGGNDDEAAPIVVVTEVPDSAGASSAAFTSYVQGLVQTDESSEPLVINSGFTLSADDDTSEPMPLT